MTRRDLEKLIPGLAEVQELEHQNRALAFAGVTHSLCGVELVSLTPFHRLGLQLVRNAYACGRAREASAEDSFQFLWFLSEAYACRAARGWWNTRRARRRIMAIVVNSEQAELRRRIAAHLGAQLQDVAETVADNSPDYSASVHWMAAEAGFWLETHGGFTLESYRHTPYLVLQQLHRAWRCRHPNVVRSSDGSYAPDWPSFINSSDSVVGLYHRSMAAYAAQEIRKQVHRLP